MITALACFITGKRTVLSAHKTRKRESVHRSASRPTRVCSREIRDTWLGGGNGFFFLFFIFFHFFRQRAFKHIAKGRRTVKQIFFFFFLILILLLLLENYLLPRRGSGLM